MTPPLHYWFYAGLLFAAAVMIGIPAFLFFWFVVLRRIERSGS